MGLHADEDHEEREMSKTKIYCFFRMEEYIQVFPLTPVEQKTYDKIRDDEDYEFGDDINFAEQVLASRGIFTQDPSLTFIITDSIPVTDEKGKVITEL